MAGTTIPSITADGFAQRLAATYPNGWASPEAMQPGGVFYALHKMVGGGLSFVLGAVAYALGSTRVQTAAAPELDLASQDFFGSALPRLPGESDTAYRARIEQKLLFDFSFNCGATRQSVIDAIENVTGLAPRVIEPWRPMDTGVIDGQPGAGMMFLDCDSPEAPARITDPIFYQGFIETILPTIPVLGGNPLPCMDVGMAPSGLYTDTAGSSMFDFTEPVPPGEQAVYDAINSTKVFGTIAWTNFTQPIPPPAAPIIVSDSGVELTP